MKGLIWLLSLLNPGYCRDRLGFSALLEDTGPIVPKGPIFGGGGLAYSGNLQDFGLIESTGSFG